MRAALASALALVAGSLHAAPARADAAEVFWRGGVPCTSALSRAQRVPGATLTRDGARAATYRLAGGSRLVVAHPDVRTHEVTGGTFADAWTYMTRARPLQDRIAGASESWAVLATVRNRVAVQYLTDEVDGVHLIRPGSVTFRVTPRMQLADWSARAGASEEDRRLWDRKRCEHIHHELGHVAIAAQTLAERAPDFARIRGTETGVERRVRAFMDDLDEVTRVRHDTYHAWIAGWGREIAHARPYGELGFPWLSDPAGWDALVPGQPRSQARGSAPAIR